MRRGCEGLVDGDDVLGEVLALGEDEGNALGRVVSAWPATASAIGSSWSLADGGHRRFPSRSSFLRIMSESRMVTAIYIRLNEKKSGYAMLANATKLRLKDAEQLSKDL